MTSLKKFIVIKASAGSGKTYQLVLHYLSCALKKDSPTHYTHILAITFTNAAANEMKQRVLKALREITDGTAKKDFTDKLKENLQLSDAELLKRAKQTYSHILHHYSKLSIFTIDSFTHRLVRSFTKDLQLNNDFTIELNAENLQEKAVDRMLELIGHDELLTQYLHRYSKNLLEDGKAWNPREGLIEMAKVIFTESGQVPLQKLSNVDLQQIQQEYAALNTKIRSLEHAVQSTSETLLLLLGEAGVTADCIPHKSGGYIAGLVKIVKNQKLGPPTKRLLQLFNNRNWLHADCPVHVLAQFSGVKTTAEKLADELMALLSDESLNKLSLMRNIKDNLYTLGLIDRMNEYALEIRDEENMLLLADFHRMINQIIQSNEAPFIFERIGARYHHILVDEFQDTSKMQWMNLIPLIHNCLSEGNENLVVGDAKQSIYRWRSANVEQFTMLPDIPAEFGMYQAQKTFHSNLFKKPLLTNFRSSRAVIDFNNTLFPALATQLEGCENVYGEVVQEKKSERTGFVKLMGDHLLKKTDDGYDSFVKDSLLMAIEECISSKYTLGDITILVRSGNDGMKCTEILKEAQINFSTAENALLIHSVCVRVIMGYFEFSMFPQHRFSGFDVIQSLASIDSRISLPDFIERCSSDNQASVIDLVGYLTETYGDLSDIMQGENVFHMAVSLMRKFNLPTDSGAEYFLDLIKQQCIGKNLDLHRFIIWWKEHRHKLSAVKTTRPDAVNIMTIHKSKGLEFPVVILPRFYDTGKNSSIWIDVPKEFCDLPTAYVSVSPKSQNNSTDEEEEVSLNEEINHERNMRLLDDLNNLYVACTRAEDRFYFIQKSGGNYFNKTLDATMKHCFPDYAVRGFYESGTREEREQKTVETKSTRTLRKAQLKGKEILYPQLVVMSNLQRDTPEILYGKLLHECLSLIQHAHQKEHVIERVLNGRKDAELFHEKLHRDLGNLLDHEISGSWFSANETIYCEREVVSRRGTTLRPDRVIVSNEKVVVIDYKTGAQRKQHSLQVEMYKEELQTIYNKPVEGYLLYTEGPAVVAV